MRRETVETVHLSRRNSTRRRLAALGRVQAALLRPGMLDSRRDDVEDTISPKQAEQRIRRGYEQNFVDELGPDAAGALLGVMTVRYLAVHHALRLLVVAALPTLLWIHPVRTALALHVAAYLVTRPLAWLNRGRGARCAGAVIVVGAPAPLARPRAARRALARNLASIPAAAVASLRWGPHLTGLLDIDEGAHEIAVKLADQFDGTVADLIETSRALAR